MLLVGPCNRQTVKQVWLQTDSPPDMTVFEGSPCIAASTYALTLPKLASFNKPELRMAPAPAGPDTTSP